MSNAEPIRIYLVLYCAGVDCGDEVRFVSRSERAARSFLAGYKLQPRLSGPEWAYNRLTLEVWQELADGNFKRLQREHRFAELEEKETRT